MNSLRIFKKLIKFSLCFFILSVLSAFPLCSSPLLALDIPSDLAQVQENFQGTNGKTIVLIQEAHVEYGAQKAIADLLKTLAEKNSLRLVLVEGGWDDVSLAYLRNVGSPEGRREVAERYLKEGKISGEEYLDIVSDLELRLWGIEDPKLYEQNMKAFLAITAEQEKWLGELATLKKAAWELAEKNLSPKLVALLKKKEAFEEEKISLLDYIKYLATLQRHPERSEGSQTRDASASPQHDELESFPHLKKLVAASGIQADFDMDKVELEKQGLIQALSRKLTKPELEKLQILEARKNPQEELAFLKSLIDLYRKHASSFRNLSVSNLAFYAASLEGAVRMDARQLFPEIEKFEDVMTSQMAVGGEQKKLLAMLKSAQLLKKLFELKLGPEDFEKIEKNPDDFKPRAWDLRHSEESAEGGRRRISDARSFAELRSAQDDIESAIPQAMSFYHSARKRENALIENALKKVEAEKDSVAALIAGGFHTERLAQSFKKRGYSVIVVAPRFTPAETLFQHQKYFEIMKYKWGQGPESGPIPAQNAS